MLTCRKQTEITALNEVFLSALASGAEDSYLQVMQNMQLFLTGYNDSSILLFIDVFSDAIYVVGKKCNVYLISLYNL